MDAAAQHTDNAHLVLSAGTTLRSAIMSEVIGGAWDLSDVCREFECSERSIDVYQRHGLPYFIVGRKRYFDPAQARAWLEARLQRKVAA